MKGIRLSGKTSDSKPEKWGSSPQSPARQVYLCLKCGTAFYEKHQYCERCR